MKTFNAPEIRYVELAVKDVITKSNFDMEEEEA